MKSPDVFLCYSSRDRKFAESLINALQDEGFSIWWDQCLPGGNRYDKSIEEALNAAKSILVLWSENSVESDYILSEASIGKSKGNLIPAMIEEVSIPLEFRRIQSIQLQDWLGEKEEKEYGKLIRAIKNKCPKSQDNIDVPDEFYDIYEPIRAYSYNFDDINYIRKNKVSILSSITKIVKFNNRLYPNVSIKILPAVFQIVSILKGCPDEDLRIATIQATLELRRPNSQDSEISIKTIFTIAAEKDSSIRVKNAAKEALRNIGR